MKDTSFGKENRKFSMNRKIILNLSLTLEIDLVLKFIERVWYFLAIEVKTEILYSSNSKEEFDFLSGQGSISVEFLGI